MPHVRRFGIQPDRACGAACHGREDIEPRIVVIVASIPDDEQGRAGVECVHVFAVEIVERPAQVSVVMSAGHAPQNGCDGFIRVRAAEILRDGFEMVDESEGMRLADLSLQCE